MTRNLNRLSPGVAAGQSTQPDDIQPPRPSEIPLHELRHTRALSQARLAKQLEVNQAAVSKIERRSDMYVSTLRAYIQAMGGDLQMVARFPDGDVKILSFPDDAPPRVEGA